MADKSEEEPKNEGTENPSPTKKGKKTKPPKVKKEGAVPLPMIIGASVGAVLLITVSVIVGTIVASSIFGEKSESEASTEKIVEAVQEALKGELGTITKSGKTPEELDSMEVANMSKGADVLTFETGKITSNSKGSSNTFVVIDLSIDFRIYDKENTVTKELTKGEGEKLELNLESSVLKKIKNRITGKINELIASYSEQEFQSMRPELKNIIRTQLRPVFHNFGLQLGEIQILTFIIQQN